MNLRQIITELGLEILTDQRDMEQTQPISGYASDLLSCVMTGAHAGGIWVTLQSHINIVAVAALLELAAVIITENARPEPGTIAKANEQGITLLLTSLPTFEIVGRLWNLGLPSGNL